MKIRIGSRGSRLSIAQVNEVISLLKSIRPDIEVEVLKIKTSGDIDRETPLYKIRDKGIFEREVNKALLDGVIDLAVHSAKDIPFDAIKKRMSIGVPSRRSRYDTIVSREGYGIWDLPNGAIVGTSSLRRMSFIKLHRRDLEIKNIRGNIDTRLEKLYKGLYNAIVIAEAGIERLKIDANYRRLPLNILVPAAGQGALIVTARNDDEKMIDLIDGVTDSKSYVEVIIEKMFMERIGFGCKAPLGVTSFYDIDAESITFYAATVEKEEDKMIFFKQDFMAPEKQDIKILMEIVEEAYNEFKLIGGLKAVETWWDEYEQ